MILVGKKDSIIDVLRRIEQEEGEQIILKFPFGHPILHNYLSLKIIHHKSSPKQVLIITSDIRSRNIGKPIGIEYSIIQDEGFFKTKEKTNLLHHNYTFFEYLKFEIKKNFQDFRKIISKKIQTIPLSHIGQKKKSPPLMILFISGLVLMTFLFSYIFYFAVNKTYIYITPEEFVDSKAKNITFTEDEIDGTTLKNTEKLIKIEKNIYLEENYGTTGIKEGSEKRATGNARLINKLPEKIQLLPKTRLLREDGVLYETLDWTNIPAATSDTPGEVVVKIQAKSYDSKGQFTGSRGNTLSGIYLEIPGLKSNKEMIFATTESDIRGGNDNFEKIVNTDDLKNAEAFITEKLKAKARSEVQDQIKQENEKNNATYDILNIDNIYQYSDISIHFPEDPKIGQEQEDFLVTGSLKISTYIYNTDSVINTLRQAIDQNILTQTEKVVAIHKHSLRAANILYQSSNPFEVKATMEIEYLVTHNFIQKDNGYIDKLKGLITGIPIEEAEKILINDPKISRVKISSRPFFIKNVSSIEENITFEPMQ